MKKRPANPKKQIQKIIPTAAVLKKDSLEDLTKGVRVSRAPANEGEVIEELVSELKVSDTYKRIETKTRKEKLDEEDAIELGVKPDNYYTTAKSKEDEDDELGGIFEEASGSFGHRGSGR